MICKWSNGKYQVTCAYYWLIHMKTQIENEFLEESVRRINYSYEFVIHCLKQLREEHIWYRPEKDINSIGIILNHLNGNLKQWIISGVGGTEDDRNRPQEFEDDKRQSKDELIQSFTNTINECKKTIQELNREEILGKRVIEGSEETILSAIYGSVNHLASHTAQIIYIARLLLKNEYEFRYTYQGNDLIKIQTYDKDSK